MINKFNSKIKKFLIFKYFQLRSKSLLLLKNCQLVTKYKEKDDYNKNLEQNFFYNLSITLKNLILGTGVLKSTIKIGEAQKIKFCKRNLIKSRNFQLLLVQSGFNYIKAKFLPVNLKKNLLLSNILGPKKTSKSEIIKKLSKFIPFVKFSTINKENQFAFLSIFKTNRHYSFLYKNKNKKIKQRKTNTFQKFDKLIGYINSEKQIIIDFEEKTPLPKVLYNQIF